MQVTEQFDAYLREITPSPAQQETFWASHQRLHDIVHSAPELDGLILAAFLQGSNSRNTALRPYQDQYPDVDYVIVTHLDRQQVTPQRLQSLLRPVLRRNYHGRWDTQSRSFGLFDPANDVNLDLVITVPMTTAERQAHGDSSREELGALWLPDRSVADWVPAHPRAQQAFTAAKNDATHGLYVHVVKALKAWWRAAPNTPSRPGSYALEHLIGDCCPNHVTSIEEALVGTLDALVARLSDDLSMNRKPHSSNRGLPAQDVLARVSQGEFQAFYQWAQQAAARARRAWEKSGEDSARLWRDLLGDCFPVRGEQRDVRGGRYG